MKRALALVTTLALLLPQVAFAAEANGEEKFDPSHEFEQHPWVPIEIGPIDLSITKAVAYLILGSLLTMALGILLMRVKLSLTPGPRQALGEWIYDIAQQNIAEQGLPHKAISRWFPYVASLFLFILVINLIGFVPLPLSDERFELFGVELPTLGVYAATSSISVTLALALMTFVSPITRACATTGRSVTSRAGSRTCQRRCAAPRAARDHQPVHAAGLAVSPSLRQHARRPHADPHFHRTDLRDEALVSSAPFVIVLATAFYLFEVIIVVGIQAFIFAALSAIYIGSAIEPEH